MKLYDLTKQLLEQYEPLRSDDKKLLWAVWTKMKLVEAGSITKELYYKAPSSESVTRARRRVQENNPELQATQAVQEARKQIEKEKGTHVYRDEVVVPFTQHLNFIGNVAFKCSCQIGRNH